MRATAVRTFELFLRVEGFFAVFGAVIFGAFHASRGEVAVGATMAKLHAVVALGSAQSSVSLPTYRDTAQGRDFSDFSEVLFLGELAKEGR